MNLQEIFELLLPPCTEIETASTGGNTFRVLEMDDDIVTIGAGPSQKNEIRIGWHKFTAAIDMVKKNGTVLIGSSNAPAEPGSLRNYFKQKKLNAKHANYVAAMLVKAEIFEYVRKPNVHVRLQSSSPLETD